jgi:mycothiol synthase
MIDATAVRPEEIADCLAAVELEQLTPRQVTVEDVDRRLHFNESDPAHDARAYLVDGHVAAFAHVWRHSDHEVRVFARTRPASRGRGAGHSLLAWAIRRAREICVTCDITATSQSVDPAAKDLLVDMGFSPAREITTLVIEATSFRPHHRDLHGVVIRPYVEGNDEQLRRAHELAFASEWGYELAPSGDAWWAERDDVDPEQSLVAWDGGEVIGFCLSGGSRISEIGVIPEYRRRGIGAALLQAGLRLLISEGATEVSLQVDSLSSSGALPMYAQAGMQTLTSMTVWERHPE